MFDDSRREWLTRLAGCIGLFALLWVISLSFSVLGIILFSGSGEKSGLA